MTVAKDIPSDAAIRVGRAGVAQRDEGNSNGGWWLTRVAGASSAATPDVFGHCAFIISTVPSASLSLAATRAVGSRLRAELDRCVLLCHNCHHEVHEGLAAIAAAISSTGEAAA